MDGFEPLSRHSSLVTSLFHNPLLANAPLLAMFIIPLRLRYYGRLRPHADIHSDFQLLPYIAVYTDILR